MAITYASNHSNGKGLCQLHGASRPDPSWTPHATGSAATEVTRSYGSLGIYSCHKKTDGKVSPKVAGQVTEETDVVYTIAGQDITQTDALIGMGLVVALSAFLTM